MRELSGRGFRAGLAELARAGAGAVKELVRLANKEADARPGIVVSVATAGDLLQWHPHLHLITAYLVRTPLSLKKLVYLDGQKAVLYRSRMNPALGRNFEAMHPLEWLARMSDHIPDSGQHRTLFYGEYSSRVRGIPHPPESDASIATAEPPPRRSCSPSWARMLAKVYHVAPLVCTRCGQRMRILAFVTDQLSIGRILDHLGLRELEQSKPPGAPTPHPRVTHPGCASNRLQISSPDDLAPSIFVLAALPSP